MNEIFVFGSNLLGTHGKGAALEARLYHGAVSGQGEGLQGNSYAIPTKSTSRKIMLLGTIERHVDKFLAFAHKNPKMQFRLTPIGCGLAGYAPEDIGPMFRNAPGNVRLPPEFVSVLNARKPNRE